MRSNYIHKMLLNTRGTASIVFLVIMYFFQKGLAVSFCSADVKPKVLRVCLCSLGDVMERRYRKTTTMHVSPLLVLFYVYRVLYK